MKRKEISVKHMALENYTLVEGPAEGMCVIENAAGERARVEAGWLKIDGVRCTATGFRTAFHVRSAAWSKEG